MPKIYVTRPFPGPAIELLSQRYDVTANSENRVLSRQELMEAVAGVEVIVSLLTDKIDAEVMDAAGKQLKMIANYAIGFDNIDLEAAKERGIVVTNTPGGLTESIGEHTMALILAVARRVVEADAFVRAHQYKQWEPSLLLGQQLRGKTLGIVGLGRIGVSVVEMAKAFGMSVVYSDEFRNEKLEAQYDIPYVAFSELLKTADIVSLHVPLLPSTRHMMNAETLKQMKSTAILINTARGPVVEEKALIEALKNNQIFGAGIDVFENEPDVSDELCQLSNVVLTPHIASSTIEARTEMSNILAKNVISVLEDGKPLNPVF